MNIAIAGRPEEVRMDAKGAGNARLFPLAGRTKRAKVAGPVETVSQYPTFGCRAPDT
jgi:hypothetical protein